MNIAIAIITVGLTFGTVQMSNSMNPMQPNQTSEFQRIEQPIEIKMAVTIAGLGLIGLELWWFLFSQPNQSTTKNND